MSDATHATEPTYPDIYADIAVDLSQYWDAAKEHCGFILESGDIVEVENISATPDKTFQIGDEDLEQYLPQAVASWHTHTGVSANLSLSDYYTFLEFPELDHYIVSKTSSLCFGDENGQLIIKGYRVHDHD